MPPSPRIERNPAPFREQHAFRVLAFLRWFPFPEAHRLALAGPESSFVKMTAPHPTQHALFAPSAADRWAACYGSTALIQHFRGKNFNSTSEFADLGTDAHTLASNTFDQLLKGEWSLPAAKAYLNACVGMPLPMGNTVDREMVKYVGTYVAAILEHTGEPANVAWMAHEVKVEIRVDGEHVTSGTADFALITADWAELQIHDLKYGLGVTVEAERNRQMLLYAAGVYHRIVELFGGYASRIRKIRTVIHQPRLHARPEWDCTTDHMLASARGMAICVEEGRKLIATAGEWIGTYKEKQHLTVTPKGCRWCTAKPFCSEQLAFISNAIGEDMKDIVALKGDGEKIAAAYAKLDQIKQWVKAIEQEAFSLAQQARLPGFKIVDGRAGDRQWKDEAALRAFLEARGISQDQYAPPSLLSPSQAGKQLPLSETDWQYLDEVLIYRSDPKPTIAPATDPRPGKATINAFADLTAPPTSGISDLL